MSSPSSNAIPNAIHEGHEADWAARLIPGDECSDKRQKENRTGESGILRLPDFRSPVGQSPRAMTRGLRSVEELQGNGPDWIGTAMKDGVLVLLDWILVAQVFSRFHTPFFHSLEFPGLTVPISRTIFGIAFLHAVLINLLNFPDRSFFKQTKFRAEISGIAKPVLWSTLVSSATLQLHGLSPLAGVAVWSAGVLHLCTLCAWRWAEGDGKKLGFRSTRGVRNVLIVGSGPVGHRIATYIEQHPELDRSFCGFLDDRKALGAGVGGCSRDLMALARTGFVDELILTPPHEPAATQRMVHTARQLRLDVKMAPNLFGCEPAGKSENLANIPLISLHQENLPVGELLLKRALDVGVAGTELLVLAPALALIALLIRVDSAGPVIYKAPRAGRKGKPFPCYKFRTMQQHTDDLKKKLREQNQRSGPFFKIKDDPRITRIGKFLRRYSLDELPQLWNVLQGDMSLVGPRPHPLDDVSGYAIEHLSRLDVPPGITGLWQVEARHNPSFQTALKLDIEYIHHWSLRADLLILLKTAGAVLRGSGE